MINVFIPTVIDEHQKSQEGRVTNKWCWDRWLITVVKMRDSPVNFGPKENSYGLEKKNLKNTRKLGYICYQISRQERTSETFN